mgnify:CR=1 FL=1
MLLALVLACSSPNDPGTDGPPAPVDTSSTTDTTSVSPTGDTGTSTTPTGTTDTVDSSTFTIVDGTGDSATGDTGTPGTSFDCSQPWPKKLPYTATLTGWTQAEDFDFDAEGYVVSVENSNLVGRDPYGNAKIYTPNIGNWTAGTRALPTGDFVVADAGAGELVLVDKDTGGKTVLLGGLNYPNGVEVDEDNNVYVAQNSGAQVNRVNAYDPYDREVVATGVVEPNGLILSPDGQTLYIGSFGGGKIFAVDRNPAGGWYPHRVFYDPNQSDSGFDGINVDICGNVYITEFISGNIYRVSPDGQEADVVAELPSSWIPNLRWGVGVAGWDPDTLYVADRDQGRLFAINVGIPGKPHVLAP